MKYKKYAVPRNKALEIIKKANIPEFPLMLSGKIFRAYDMDDLKKVLFLKEVPTNLTLMEPELKAIEQQRSKMIDRILEHFKKKEKFDQDFISF